MTVDSSSPKWSLWLCALWGPALLLVFTLSAHAADRKVKQQFSPQYPALARQFNASGIVKLSVDVTPGGEVKGVKVLGGNPLLVQSAQEAVRKWKYEPSKESTTEVVEFKFVPNQ